MGGIGGYLGLERYAGKPCHPGAIALNSGRNCLAYLVELRGIERIALPDFMCDAVAGVCRRMSVEVRNYQVGGGFALPADLSVADDEWLYVADYYGTLTAEAVEWAREVSGGRLVVDEVQGFFRRPWPGVDTLYTCRKFFGVPDGAYLATGDGARLARGLPPGSSRSRMAHVLGRAEAGSAEFYGAYREAEEAFGAEPVTAMSAVTASLMGAVDFEAVKVRRERNFTALHAAFGRFNLLDPGAPEGPYMYPLLVGDASGMREKLAAAGVFVPTLWPSVLEECDPTSWAYRYSKDILPLPVDQRYGNKEMRLVAREVEKCLR